MYHGLGDHFCNTLPQHMTVLIMIKIDLSKPRSF